MAPSYYRLYRAFGHDGSKGSITLPLRLEIIIQERMRKWPYSSIKKLAGRVLLMMIHHFLPP
jgi:hypothetical protein